MDPELDDEVKKIVKTNRFGMLFTIVKYLKQRHHSFQDEPIKINDLLRKTHLYNIPKSEKIWLIAQALLNNPKVMYIKELQGFKYNPVFKERDANGLICLLKRYDQDGLGGIPLEDLQDSIVDCENVLKIHANKVIIITRPIDKKQIVFYNDNTFKLEIHKEIKEMWHTLNIGEMDDVKIEDYLKTNSLNAIKGIKRIKRTMKQPFRNKKMENITLKDNIHVQHILNEYDDEGDTRNSKANPIPVYTQPPTQKSFQNTNKENVQTTNSKFTPIPSSKPLPEVILLTNQSQPTQFSIQSDLFEM